MPNTAFDLVVIGGGPGGYAAAFRAADHGLKTAIVELDDRLGGVCLLRGCIPSKALLHAAQVIHETQEMAAWGLKFPRPQIDLDALRDKKETIVDKLSRGTGTLAKLRNVSIIHGRARFLDRNRLSVLGGEKPTEVRFKNAIIATGSRPVIPRTLYIDDERWFDSTRALDLPFIPERLLVIGGGYIGMELGTVYEALGSKVTVVEGLDRILNTADPDLARHVAKRAQARFQAVRTNTKVEGLRAEKTGIVVTLRGPGAGEDEKEEAEFDAVLVSVGRRPNSEDLGLETTRVRINDKGFIEVDRQMRTGEANIFAIGDVAGEPMLAHKASHEGFTAVGAIVGGEALWDKKAVPAVVFTDPELAWCGKTEAEAKEEGLDVKVLRFPWSASGRATTLDRNDGVTKLVCDAESGRVIGVGIAGTNAGELISEGVLAVEMGAVAEDIAGSIHPHPTLSETLMEAAEMFAGHATHHR